MRPRLVIVGNGMVGLRFVENLVDEAPSQFDVTVIGAEPRAAYNRVLLSPLLAGEITADDVAMKPADWYADNDISLRLGQRAQALDTVGKTITLDGGETIPFDACVLATGSKPVRLPITGADQLRGVHTFRGFDDVSAFRAAASRDKPAVVIGGGLLGIETAYGLARAGVDVCLVHVMDRLMERQLDAEGGALLKTALEKRNIRVLLKASTDEIFGDGNGAVAGIRLKDGTEIEAGMVVMAVGVRADVDLAKNAGLEISRGIKVDDTLQTSAADVYAIGECAEHRGICYGLVEPGYEQAKLLVSHLAGVGSNPYSGNVLATNLKVSGVPVFSAGDFSGEGASNIITRDRAQGAYRRLLVREDRLVGVVLVGDTADALWYRDLIAQDADISSCRDVLAFGRAFATAA
ncbi:MAG: FAD-dependent oxidoreductase [Pseudomonadota bacterium]